MDRTLGIAGIQMTVIQGQDNSDAMIANLNIAHKRSPWVDIFFFSELCACGVDKTLAMPLSHPVLDKFRRWAESRKKWVIPGSFFELDGEKIHNTAVVISPDGAIAAKYRKIFPWRPTEDSDPGEDFCVFDVPGKGRLGLCICYDQWFPEVARTLAWMGAEAVFCPTATLTPDRTQEIVMARSNAIANQMYWLSLNGLGAGGIGQSAFIDPEGRILQQGGEGHLIMTEIIDLDLVSRARTFGTAGYCQVLKEFADFRTKFPVYRENEPQGELLESLGAVKKYAKLEP
jgi:deaminated glutathione amidase